MAVARRRSPRKGEHSGGGAAIARQQPRTHREAWQWRGGSGQRVHGICEAARRSTHTRQSRTHRKVDDGSHIKVQNVTKARVRDEHDGAVVHLPVVPDREARRFGVVLREQAQAEARVRLEVLYLRLDSLLLRAQIATDPVCRVAPRSSVDYARWQCPSRDCTSKGQPAVWSARRASAR